MDCEGRAVVLDPGDERAPVGCGGHGRIPCVTAPHRRDRPDLAQHAVIEDPTTDLERPSDRLLPDPFDPTVPMGDDLLVERGAAAIGDPDGFAPRIPIEAAGPHARGAARVATTVRDPCPSCSIEGRGRPVAVGWHARDGLGRPQHSREVVRIDAGDDPVRHVGVPLEPSAQHPLAVPGDARGRRRARPGRQQPARDATMALDGRRRRERGASPIDLLAGLVDLRGPHGHRERRAIAVPCDPRIASRADRFDELRAQQGELVDDGLPVTCASHVYPPALPARDAR